MNLDLQIESFEKSLASSTLIGMKKSIAKQLIEAEEKHRKERDIRKQSILS